MDNSVIIYEPDNSLKKGYWAIFLEIIDEINRNRWLTWQLFKRDFFAMYKQSFMGFFWAFIIPIVSISTFILLNASGVFKFGDISVPYPIYSMLGMTFWQLFSTGLIASTNSIVKAGEMITKINFSKKSLVIASAGQAIVSFLIQIALIALLFIAYRVAPNVRALLVPLAVIPMILLTLGLGFILSLLNGVIRDVGNLISILLTFLMFLTPILYAKPNSGALTQITKFNPLYYMISAARNLVLNGTIPDIAGFLISTVVSFVIFILCLLAFHLTETRICERI